MNALTRKNREFVWDEICEKSFQLLKQMIVEKPILVYPDPNKPYVLFTDASKYAWSCVLMQEYIDKWGCWVFSRLVCTLQTLYAWLMRGFGIGVVWNP